MTLIKRTVLAVGLCGLAQSAAAELTQDRRASLLSFYPCAVSLSDDELVFLADWANALGRDPCALTAAEFTSNFVTQSGGEDVAPIDHVQSYFSNQNKSVLFVQQVLVLGRDDADGLWGPTTRERFENLLQTYHAIGGIDDSWGVRTPDDVPRFLAWIAAAEYAIAVGGEFPD